MTQGDALDRAWSLCDPGSVQPVGAVPPAGTRAPEPGRRDRRARVAGGYGRVDGRPVCVLVVTEGAGDVDDADRLDRQAITMLDLAVTGEVPFVSVWARGSAGGGAFLRAQVLASGQVPQVAVVLEGAAGDLPLVADFTVVVGGDPDSCDYVAEDDEDALSYARALLALLPSSWASGPAPGVRDQDDRATLRPSDLELDTLLPASYSQAYDVRSVIERLVDDGYLLEVGQDRARNVVVGLAEVAGTAVGVVANQPMHLAGTLDAAAAEKAARFVRTCDAFGLPIVTLVDVPGFLPGVEQEHRGIIRRGAKLIFAYAEATVPLITVTLRKAFGGAQVVMGARHLGADLCCAWPGAQVAVMGAAGAIDVLYRREIRAAADSGQDVAAVRALLVTDYEEHAMSLDRAVELGAIDAVVAPRDTRRYLADALEVLAAKTRPAVRRRHENVPL